MFFGNFGNAAANAGKRGGLFNFSTPQGGGAGKPQRPRGLFGGDWLGQRNDSGISRGEQLGAMLMSLAGPEYAAAGMNMLSQRRGEHGDMMRLQQEEQREQEVGQKNDLVARQQREQQADQLGLQGRERALFLLSPDVWSEQTGRNLYRQVDAGSHDITPDGERYMPDPLGEGRLAVQQGQLENDTRNTNSMIQDRTAGQALARERFELDRANAEREAGQPNYSDERTFRQEYLRESQPFTEVRDAYARLQASEETAAGDISLVISYMKMLDPGSVVREGEFATAQNAAGVPAQVRNTYNRMLSGERLTQEQRAQFRSQGDALFEQQRLIHDRRTQQYQSLAQQYGFDPNRITLELGQIEQPGSRRLRYNPETGELE